MNIKPKERLKQIFDLTIESGLSHQGSLDELDFYSLLCKAATNNYLYKILGCNLCMFKYKFNGEDSILIIISIPLSLNENIQINKHISERIMDILKIIEESFSIIDFMNLKDVKEDKFFYMTIVKKLEGVE